MPPLVRFMIMHAAVGFALAFVFVGAILAVDLSGLRSLMMASDMGWVALFMVFFSTAGFWAAGIAGPQMRHRSDFTFFANLRHAYAR